MFCRLVQTGMLVGCSVLSSQERFWWLIAKVLHVCSAVLPVGSVVTDSLFCLMIMPVSRFWKLGDACQYSPNIAVLP